MKHAGSPLLFALVALALTPPSHAQEDPPDATPERGLRLCSDAASDGYTLFAPLRSTSTYLVDMDGELVHEWKSEHTPGNSVYLLDDGNLLRCCRTENERFRGGGQGGRIQKLAWDSSVLWDWVLSDDSGLLHHDIAPLPNGNILVVTWEDMTREGAISVGRDPEQTAGEGFWPDAVLEIEPVGTDDAKVVWEWHAWDHLIQDHDPQAAGYGDVTAHPELIDVNADHRDKPPLSAAQRAREAEIAREMAALGYTGDEEDDEDEDGGERRGGRGPGADWLHTNSIDYHPGHDLIVLSSRSLSEVWVIDHSTTTAEAAGHSGGRFEKGGDLLYRWGNPKTYGAGKRKDQQLFVQHDAQWVPGDDPDDLRLTVFNNGEGRPDGPFSSVDEIHLPFDPETGFQRADGEAFGPAEPAWSYTAPDPASFFSSFISGAHRLPNGNTLICSGAQGRLFEVTPAKDVVWDYLNPYGAGVARDGPGSDRERARRGPPGQPGAQDGRRRGPPPGAPGRGPGGPGGPGGMAEQGLFRAKRLSPDHPGLAKLAE